MSSEHEELLSHALRYDTPPYDMTVSPQATTLYREPASETPKQDNRPTSLSAKPT